MVGRKVDEPGDQNAAVEVEGPEVAVHNLVVVNSALLAAADETKAPGRA